MQIGRHTPQNVLENQSSMNLRKDSLGIRNLDLTKSVEPENQNQNGKTSSRFYPNVNSARKASAALAAEHDESHMSHHDYKEMIRNILEKKNRTDEEAWTLYEQIKDFKFFNQVLSGHADPDDILKVVKSLRYRKVKAGKPVFMEGEASNGNMYVVFSGELLVMVKKLDVIAQTNLTAGRKVAETKVTFINLSTPVHQEGNGGNPLKTLQTDDSFEDDDQKQQVIIQTTSELNSGKKKSRFRNVSKAKILDRKPVEKVNTMIVEKESVGSSLTVTKPDAVTSVDILGSSSHNFADPDSPRHAKKEHNQDQQEDANPFGYVKDKIKKGGYFGERALESNANRGATIVANTDCELLVLTTQTYNSLKNEFNKKIKQMMDFIIEALPGLRDINAKAIIKNYIYLFEERTFYYGNHIVNEGEKGDYFYFVYEGNCEVYRTIKIEEDEELPAIYSKIRSSFFSQSFAVKEKIPLTLLKEGGLIGEELLFSEEALYNYSVQVSSNTLKVICVNKDVFQFRFPKEVIQKIKQAYEEKKHYKNTLLFQALEKRDISIVKSSIDAPFLTVKRKSTLDCTKKVAKINKSPSQFISYKIMMQDNSPAENTKSNLGSPTSLPKLAKSRSTLTLDPAETQLKQKIMSYSRASIMPGSKDFGLALSEFEQQQKNHEGLNKVDHIRKSSQGSPYHNINDVYDNISMKLKLDKGSKTTKANINDASSLKLDFGKAYEFEERWLAMAKKRIGGKGKLPEHPHKMTPASIRSANLSPIRENGHYVDSPVSINKLHSVLKSFDIEKLKENKTGASIKDEQLQQQPQQSTRDEKKFEPTFIKDFNQGDEIITVARKKKSSNTMVVKGLNIHVYRQPKKNLTSLKVQNPKPLPFPHDLEGLYSIQTPITLEDQSKTHRLQKSN